MTDAERATRRQAGVERIFEAMGGPDDDPVLPIGVLGSVVSCIATAAPDPKACTTNIMTLAEGITGGELPEPAA